MGTSSSESSESLLSLTGSGGGLLFFGFRRFFCTGPFRSLLNLFRESLAEKGFSDKADVGWATVGSTSTTLGSSTSVPESSASTTAATGAETFFLRLGTKMLTPPLLLVLLAPKAATLRRGIMQRQ